jgi:hypothetical protein
LKRITRRGGSILALAEPDYSARIDQPEELAQLGQWQIESLKRQGAHPSFGGQLAETFQKAGIHLLETGPIHAGALSSSKGQNRMRAAEEWRQEWNVIETDLAGLVPAREIQRMKSLDEKARERGERVLHVPTFFAWGKT